MFRKINCSNIYLSRADKKDYKTLTIHVTCSEMLDQLKAIFLEMGLDINDVVPLKKRNNDILKNMEWIGMPKYEIESEILNTLHFRILYTDENQNFINAMLTKLGNPKIINKSIWYPERLKELNSLKNKYVIEQEQIVPKYPIYIISKGRYETGTTAKYLTKCGIGYKLVVEPKEYNLYIQNGYNAESILVCPENFSEQGKGGIPVRNFVWEHSINLGALKHWILDDNIYNYFLINRGQKNKIYSGAIFRQIEDYADRYTNVKMCGHNYSFFVPSSQNPYPIIKNTRIYSSILLSNDIYPEYNWRGRYNEDTDLSLRLLKAGYPTILFNNICANKATTMKTKGGNTDTIYAVENAHLLKSQELVDNHPDCAKVVTRFGRLHHLVDYTKFKHLVPEWIAGIKETLPNENNYGLIYVDDSEIKNIKTI